MAAFTYTCYLLKSSIEQLSDAIRDNQSFERIELSRDGFHAVAFFRARQEPVSPGWVHLLSNYTGRDLTAYVTATASAVIIVEHTDRLFAIPFGYGWTIINDDATEENFGLRIVLNSVTPESMKAIDAKSFEGATITRRNQASRNMSVYGFGLDVQRNLISAISGSPRDRALWGPTLDGKDSLRFTTQQPLHELGDHFEQMLTLESDDSYKTDHPWVDRIKIEKNTELIDQLDTELERCISDRVLDPSWLTQPTTIDRTRLSGFKFSSRQSEIPSIELNWDAFFLANPDRGYFDIDWLKAQHVSVLDTASDDLLARWQVHKCIYMEIDRDDSTYFISDGKWYVIEKNYLEQINEEIEPLFVTETDLPTCEGLTEQDFNEGVAQNPENEYRLLDRRLVSLPVARSSMEFCDLMTPTKKLVHVKHYSGSSTLSHLFYQGHNSALLLKNDHDFRMKANETLEDELKVDETVNFKSSDYTIIYGIIRPGGTSNRDLPVFSRISLRLAAQQIRAMDFRVEVHMINSIPANSTQPDLAE